MFDQELWTSDGTPAGTTLVKQMSDLGGRIIENLTVVGTRLFFTYADSSIPFGYQLWRSDGTEVGTTLVKDVYYGYNPKRDTPGYLTAMGDILLFVANDGIHGRELWRSDGTEVGTTLVRDINANTSAEQDFAPEYLTVLGNKLFFVANDGIHGQELWRSDGTEAGTVLLKDIQPGASAAAPYALITVGSSATLRGRRRCPWH